VLRLGTTDLLPSISRTDKGILTSKTLQSNTHLSSLILQRQFLQRRATSASDRSHTEDVNTQLPSRSTGGLGSQGYTSLGGELQYECVILILFTLRRRRTEAKRSPGRLLFQVRILSFEMMGPLSIHRLEGNHCNVTVV
jgi:hypothetical protein